MYGVFEDVLDRGNEMGVPVYGSGRKPLLEEVATAPVPAVERLGVEAIETVHPVGHSFTGCFDEKVVMRAEQTPGVAAPAEPDDRVLEQAKEALSIAVVDEDHRSAHAA